MKIGIWKYAGCLFSVERALACFQHRSEFNQYELDLDFFGSTVNEYILAAIPRRTGFSLFSTQIIIPPKRIRVIFFSSSVYEYMPAAFFL